MEKREIRLIGLDLDGTTLTTEKVLTPHTKEVLETCIRQGIVVLPATGRASSGIPDYLKEIEGMRYVVTSNGANIFDMKMGKTIYENGIAWERALELFDILEQYHTYYDCYTMGSGWCEGRFFDHLDDYNIDRHVKDIILSSRKRIGNLREFLMEKKSPVEKINMFFADLAYRQEVFEELTQIPDIAVTYSLTNNIEINHVTCDKGNALIQLGEILSIPRESIMGCGDGINDLAMIQKVGLGVVMANGDETLKKYADFITKSNDEEGVAYAIETFCDI